MKCSSPRSAIRSDVLPEPVLPTTRLNLPVLKINSPSILRVKFLLEEEESGVPSAPAWFDHVKAASRKPIVSWFVFRLSKMTESIGFGENESSSSVCLTSASFHRMIYSYPTWFKNSLIRRRDTIACTMLGIIPEVIQSVIRRRSNTMIKILLRGKQSRKNELTRHCWKHPWS